MDELEPNSNIFFAWGSSPVAPEAADALPPKGLLDPNAGEAAPKTGAVVELDADPNAGADCAAACPKIDPEALPAGVGVPKVLEPNVGVELVALLVADPKLPKVGVLVDGLPKMGVAEAAATDGEPNTGVELLLPAPNVNADVVDSAGFTAAAAAPPKLNPEEPVVAALPKIELPAAGAAAVELAVAAGVAAPNVPNVGLSEDAAADAPNVGTTLLVD